MGSYDPRLVLLSPEFTCRTPRLTAPDSTICKCDAALAHAVTPVTVREALPLVGISVHSPGAPRPPLRRRDCRPRRPLARHLCRSRLHVLRRRRLGNAERRVRPEQQARAEEQCAGGLPGEEEPSHAPEMCNATAK